MSNFLKNNSGFVQAGAGIVSDSIPNNELKEVCSIIKEEMISVVNSDLHSFSTPLTVDINIGENWGILH